MTENPMSCLWRKLSGNILILAKLFEFIKVVEISHVQALGSVDDKITFSFGHFLRNRLKTHLDLVVHMFSPKFEHIPLPSSNIRLESLEGLQWRGRVDKL